MAHIKGIGSSYVSWNSNLLDSALGLRLIFILKLMAELV